MLLKWSREVFFVFFFFFWESGWFLVFIFKKSLSFFWRADRGLGEYFPLVCFDFSLFFSLEMRRVSFHFRFIWPILEMKKKRGFRFLKMENEERANFLISVSRSKNDSGCFFFFFFFSRKSFVSRFRKVWFSSLFLDRFFLALRSSFMVPGGRKKGIQHCDSFPGEVSVKHGGFRLEEAVSVQWWF